MAIDVFAMAIDVVTMAINVVTMAIVVVAMAIDVAAIAIDIAAMALDIAAMTLDHSATEAVPTDGRSSNLWGKLDLRVEDVLSSAATLMIGQRPAFLIFDVA